MQKIGGRPGVFPRGAKGSAGLRGFNTYMAVTTKLNIAGDVTAVSAENPNLHYTIKTAKTDPQPGDIVLAQDVTNLTSYYIKEYDSINRTYILGYLNMIKLGNEINFSDITIDVRPVNKKYMSDRNIWSTDEGSWYKGEYKGNETFYQFTVSSPWMSKYGNSVKIVAEVSPTGVINGDASGNLMYRHVPSVSQWYLIDQGIGYSEKETYSDEKPDPSENIITYSAFHDIYNYEEDSLNDAGRNIIKYSNFDKEIPQRFNVLVKDFIDVPVDNAFVSKVKIPESFLNGKIISFYVYYKTPTTYMQKFYIGCYKIESTGVFRKISDKVAVLYTLKVVPTSLSFASVVKNANGTVEDTVKSSVPILIETNDPDGVTITKRSNDPIVGTDWIKKLDLVKMQGSAELSEGEDDEVESFSTETEESEPDYSEYKPYIDKDICVTCGACNEAFDVCPMGCITYDAEGYPYVDARLCNSCAKYSKLQCYDAFSTCPVGAIFLKNIKTKEEYELGKEPGGSNKDTPDPLQKSNKYMLNVEVLKNTTAKDRSAQLKIACKNSPNIFKTVDILQSKYVNDAATGPTGPSASGPTGPSASGPINTDHKRDIHVILYNNTLNSNVPNYSGMIKVFGIQDINAKIVDPDTGQEPMDNGETVAIEFKDVDIENYNEKSNIGFIISTVNQFDYDSIKGWTGGAEPTYSVKYNNPYSTSNDSIPGWFIPPVNRSELESSTGFFTSSYCITMQDLFDKLPNSITVNYDTVIINIEITI